MPQVEGYEDCETDQIYYIWHGYIYAVLLFAFLSVYSLLLSGYFEGAFLLGMDVRTALIDTVYSKSLKMSVASKKGSMVARWL